MPSLWHRLITGRQRYKRAASHNQRKNNLIKTYADDYGDDDHYSAMFYSLANLWCENDLSPSKNYFDIDAYQRMQFASAQNVSGSNNPLICGNNYQDLHSKYKNGVLNNAIHSRRLSSTNSDERGKSSSTLLRNKNKKNSKKTSKMSFFEKISNRKEKRAYDNSKFLLVPANSAAASELRMASNVCVNYVSAYNNNNNKNSRNYGDDVSSGYGGIGRGGGTYTTNINEYVPKSFRHLATSLALRGHQVIRDKFDITDFNHSNNNNKNVDNYLYHDDDGGNDFQHRIICTKLQEPTENIISGQFVLAKRNHFYNNVSISSSSGNSSSGEEPMSTSFGSSSISQAWNWETKDEGHLHDQQRMRGRNVTRNVTMEDDLGFVDSRDSDEECRQDILSTPTTTTTTTTNNNNNMKSNPTLTVGNGKAGEDQGRLSDNGSLVELQRQQITRKLSLANYVTDSDDSSSSNSNNNNNNNCGKRRNELDNLDKIIRNNNNNNNNTNNNNNNNNNNNSNGNTNTEIQIVISTVSETGNEIDMFLY